jgi:Phosphotransferase enzyme family
MSAETLRKWIRQADVDGDEVTGVVDWSEASQGDALFDVAILTLGHKEHLGDVVAATAPTSTATSSAHGGRCDARLTSAGWPSTATARPRSFPRSPCRDPRP